MSNALVSVAELWMTDLCFEPAAEERCEASVQRAMAADPSNPDALQTLASLRISQQRGADALDALKRSYALWNPAVEGDEDEVRNEPRTLSLSLFLTSLGGAEHGRGRR